MSKYKDTLKDEKEIRLDELIESAKRTMDEIAPLESYLNMIKGQIKDIMKEIGVDNFKDATLITENKKLIDLEKFSNRKSVIPYAVGYIDEQVSLSIMYKYNIDYKIAKKLLAMAIKDTTIEEYTDERIKIKI